MNKIKLDSNDPSTFQKGFREALETFLSVSLNEFAEYVSDDEKKVVLELQIASKQFGADQEDFVYEDGVIYTILRKKQAVEHFLDYLEAHPAVESYEVFVRFQDRDAGTSEETTMDLSDVEDDVNCHFDIFVYLLSNLVEYGSEEEDYEGDMDEGEYTDFEAGESVITEAIRKIRVNSRGVKKIKFKCPRGFKWNPVSKTCDKISGEELTIKRRAIRKSLITKKNEGVTLQKRIIRKRKKALRYRKSYGLK